jgi:hypothetical protein
VIIINTSMCIYYIYKHVAKLTSSIARNCLLLCLLTYRRCRKTWKCVYLFHTRFVLHIMHQTFPSRNHFSGNWWSGLFYEVQSLLGYTDSRPDDGGSTYLWNVDRHMTTRQYIPEDSEFHTSRRENLKSHMGYFSFSHVSIKSYTEPPRTRNKFCR